jgi:hypothetical protein
LNQGSADKLVPNIGNGTLDRGTQVVDAVSSGS